MLSCYDYKLADVNEKLTLQEAYSQVDGDRQSDIPFLVWLFENPASPLRFPGQISLREHDYLHIIFGCDRSPENEAWLIGFTMGNDLSTKRIHLVIFEFVSRYFYPKKYRFSGSDLEWFERGVEQGKQVSYQQINQVNFDLLQNQTIEIIREIFDGKTLNSVKNL